MYFKYIAQQKPSVFQLAEAVYDIHITGGVEPSVNYNRASLKSLSSDPWCENRAMKVQLYFLL